MFFPFKNKKIISNSSYLDILDNYELISEIPLLPHPGAFSAIRKNHIHEGIALYPLSLIKFYNYSILKNYKLLF